MEENIKKADVLIEALKYIQAFHGETIVIKYGGAAMASETIRRNVLKDIVFLNCVGMRPVLVHGGGPHITKRLAEVGKKAVFADGIRVTDEETMAVVESELMRINREIVREIIALGASATSLSGKDGRLIEVKKHPDVNGQDVGRVGEIVRVNAGVIRKPLVSGAIPVVMPVGVGGTDGFSYNVNADQAAAEIAGTMRAAKLIYLTDVRGILKDLTDPASLVSHATAAEAERLVADGIVSGGMIPKVRSCMRALAKGTKKVHIVAVDIPHALLLEIFTDTGIGTEIVK